MNKNPELTSRVNAENELKEYLVNYVGEKIKPDTDEVTVAMVIEVMSDEFPEVVLALAEENFIRGYEQAFKDIETTTESFKAMEVDEQ